MYALNEFIMIERMINAIFLEHPYQKIIIICQTKDLKTLYIY